MPKKLNKPKEWIIRIVRTGEILDYSRTKSLALYYLLPKWKKIVREKCEIVKNKL
jgi:hypothetical protein